MCIRDSFKALDQISAELGKMSKVDILRLSEGSPFIINEIAIASTISPKALQALFFTLGQFSKKDILYLRRLTDEPSTLEELS